MASPEVVADFLAQKTLALVGVSRGGRKFGNAILRDLKSRGYRVFCVHPHADRIDGERCWPRIGDLPEPVGGLVLVVPPAETERVVEEAVAAGIRRVWMQQGAESAKAIAYCKANGVSVISGACIMMFAEPVGFPHNAHRWLWRVLGKTGQ
jgi:uncharacterized protein